MSPTPMRLFLLGLLSMGAVAQLSGCMTMETQLPGVVDLRQSLNQTEAQPAEPQEPAFGRADNSFMQGITLTSSRDLPTQGRYSELAPPADLKQAKAMHSSVYRRVIRQWFLIGVLPIAGDQGLFAADIAATLSTPGTSLREIRVSSGYDLLHNLLPLVPAIGSIANLVPSRTTEVVAVVDQRRILRSPQGPGLNSSETGPAPDAGDSNLPTPEDGQVNTAPVLVPLPDEQGVPPTTEVQP